MSLSELKRILPQEDIEWRVQSQGLKRDGSPWAKIVPYVQNRAIMDILDEVCGPENWRNEFSFSPDGGFMCGISIMIAGEWVTKWDGAEKSDIEPFKGGLSNAMKRAAVQWGIGRFLYHMEEQWAVFSEDGIYNTYLSSKNKGGGDDQYHKWSPPIIVNWGDSKPAPKPQTKREPAPIESQDDIQAQRIKEIDTWLLEMADGIETDYKALLKRVTVYEKDGAEHYIRKIEEFQNKVRWTNKAHNVTKELYASWKNNRNAKAKKDPDGLFASDME